MYVELRSVAVRYGRPGKLRSVGVSLDTLWFGRLGTSSSGSVR